MKEDYEALRREIWPILVLLFSHFSVLTINRSTGSLLALEGTSPFHKSKIRSSRPQEGLTALCKTHTPYPNDLKVLVSEALREFNSRCIGVGMGSPFKQMQQRSELAQSLRRWVLMCFIQRY